MVGRDLQWVSLCSADQKEIMTISQVMCHITKVRGATEAGLLDHDMKPICKAGDRSKAIKKNDTHSFTQHVCFKQHVNLFLPGWCKAW